VEIIVRYKNVAGSVGTQSSNLDTADLSYQLTRWIAIDIDPAGGIGDIKKRVCLRFGQHPRALRLANPSAL
jgi:hypothetical protein